MPSGDMLGIGTSGLLSYQRALSTVSHNISNVNTEGYSRQITNLVARPPQGYGNGFIGTGVEVNTVSRVVDQFIIGQVWTQTSQSEEVDKYYELASRIDNLLSDPDAGMTPMLESFFNSVQGVADDPGSVPARQVMLTTSESMVERFHSMYDSMNSLNYAVNTDMRNTIEQVNVLANAIADMNDQIVLAGQKFNGQPPNDLLDQRDELVRKLSEYISVSTTVQDNGAMNVFVGTGQGLVVGSIAMQFQVAANQYDGSQLEIEITTGAGAGINITNNITGGKLGGLLQFRNEILTESLNQLGRLVVGLAEEFNQQQRQGLTLGDVLGSDYFSDLTSSTALGSRNNSGSETVTINISNVAQLKSNDYRLNFDGAAYSLVNASTQQTIASSATLAGLSTAVEATEGFTITSSTGTLTANDSYLIRPLRTVAQDISLTVSDVNDIAAAGAVRASASSANLGDSTISDGRLVIDTSDPVAVAAFNVVGPQMIEFGSTGVGPYADQYRVNGGAWQAYDPNGTTITSNGMEVEIQGDAFANDTFTMQRNTGGVNDNRNALQLAGLQTKRTLIDNGAGPTVDFQGAYGVLVAMVGTKTHQADVAGQAQHALLNQAMEDRERVSGVNLDEEAALLIRYQQSYQAAAKVITTAQTMFETLLNAVR
jgi:flagellar hook-associated protein 1 FlgK